MVFTNEVCKYKVELFDDASWSIISLPSDHERTIITNADIEIIARVMKQLGHDKEFWEVKSNE